jgi:pyridoxine kinase
MRILAISSQVAWGPVGLTAAVPALEALRHEVLALPTIILSHHPGHGAPAVHRIPAAHLAASLGALEDRGALRTCGAVMTGYFASNDQIHGVARIIRRMKENNPRLIVLVDPIIGDHDALYVPLPVAEAIRDELLPLATIATPNRFELEWLTGWRAGSLKEAEAAARHLGVVEVLATSIPAGPGTLATLALSGDTACHEMSPLRDKVPNGTGDLLSGLYLARRARGDVIDVALRDAMAVLDRAIARSAGTSVLDVAGALHGP